MEVRITIEILTAKGKVRASEVVLGEHDEEGLQGDIESSLDALIADMLEEDDEEALIRSGDHPDYPIDHDESDRNAAASERLDDLRREW